MVAEASKKAGPIYSEGTFESAESVGALIGVARKVLVEEFDRELEPLGLNTAQALVLILLADGRAATAAGICKHLSHDPGAMTRIVDKLETLDAVRRVRGSEDRRSARLELTPRGRQMHAEVTRVQVAVLNHALRGFTPGEARTLERLLRRLLGNVGGQ